MFNILIYYLMYYLIYITWLYILFGNKEPIRHI